MVIGNATVGMVIFGIRASIGTEKIMDLWKSTNSMGEYGLKARTRKTNK